MNNAISTTNYSALVVKETEPKCFERSIELLPLKDLPRSDVLIEVKYSSLNFKDALSAHGNKGVTRNYPHTPGIDAAGVVVESSSDEISVGDEVIVTGYDLGMNTFGGLAQYISVPAQWVVKKPADLSFKQSMAIGTAGLTAALCVDKLLMTGITAEQGPILVTGATGGVGSVAVMLLAKLGFSVTAVTSKVEQHDLLYALGATEIISRKSLQDVSPKPMLKPLWAGCVDTAGGDMLGEVLKQIKPGGSVAACGLASGVALNTTVLPFIIRGVNLLGIDSVEIPLAFKQKAWKKLADKWSLDLSPLTTEIHLIDAISWLERIHTDNALGRVVVSL
jgi:alcohol dehydrogenase